jgi:predicted GNAT family acetyltransferase
MEDMELKRYYDADDFLNDNQQFLFANEAANNLIIGIANGLRSRIVKNDALICSVKEHNNILLSSVMIPPRDLIVAISEMNEQAISLLINDLIANKTEVPGILAENAFADVFRNQWHEETGDETKLFRKERAYKLMKCREIKISSGQMRLAVRDDMNQIAEWIKELHNEIRETISDEGAKKISEMKIANKEIFVWIERGIVSMCASDRESQHGKAINLVYTPPQNRGKGYATSCVYNLCKRILNEGKSFCCLFADLDNRTSNAIYSRIGFNPILDFLHYRFEKGG